MADAVKTKTTTQACVTLIQALGMDGHDSFTWRATGPGHDGVIREWKISVKPASPDRDDKS